MSSSSPRVHDRFFKQIFTRPENVRDFITTYLPAEIVAHLDLESLEVVSGNYVEADLGEYFVEKELLTEYLQVVLEYVCRASEHVDASDVRDAFEKLLQGEELMPTIADKLRQEGMQ